jgi:hypothetical protein
MMESDGDGDGDYTNDLYDNSNPTTGNNTRNDLYESDSASASDGIANNSNTDNFQDLQMPSTSRRNPLLDL